MDEPTDMIQSNSQATKVLDAAAGAVVKTLSMHISADSSFSRAIAFLAAEFARSCSISFVKSSCKAKRISFTFTSTGYCEARGTRVPRDFPTRPFRKWSTALGA